MALAHRAPMEATSATEEPLMPAKRIEVIIFTWPRPPWIQPTTSSQKEKICSATPPLSIRTPARKNRGTATMVKLFMEEYISLTADAIVEVSYIKMAPREAMPRETATGMPRNIRTRNTPKIKRLMPAHPPYSHVQFLHGSWQPAHQLPAAQRWFSVSSFQRTGCSERR